MAVGAGETSPPEQLSWYSGARTAYAIEGNSEHRRDLWLAWVQYWDGRAVARHSATERPPGGQPLK